KAALEEHLAETRTHVTRLETAFRRLDAAPSANLSRGFEGMVAQHDQLAPSVVLPALADELHAAAALRVEHYEIAGYRALLSIAGRRGFDAVEPLDGSLEEEEQAAKR